MSSFRDEDLPGFQAPVKSEELLAPYPEKPYVYFSYGMTNAPEAARRAIEAWVEHMARLIRNAGALEAHVPHEHTSLANWPVVPPGAIFYTDQFLLSGAAMAVVFLWPESSGVGAELDWIAYHGIPVVALAPRICLEPTASQPGPRVSRLALDLVCTSVHVIYGWKTAARFVTDPLVWSDEEGLRMMEVVNRAMKELQVGILHRLARAAGNEGDPGVATERSELDNGSGLSSNDASVLASDVP